MYIRVLHFLCCHPIMFNGQRCCVVKIVFYIDSFVLKFILGGGSTCCLLYTSDAADDMQCVDLGGRRIIKKRGDERLSLVDIVD